MFSLLGCVSLFGGGEDLNTFTRNQIKQFQEQLEKISNAGEEVGDWFGFEFEYSSEKLRNLLRDANDIIREQLNLLQTLASGQPNGVALSFEEKVEEVAPEETEQKNDLVVCSTE